MKRIFALLTALLMLLTFASCNDSGSEGTDTLTATEIVTDKDGEAVTNAQGEALTEVVTVPDTLNGETTEALSTEVTTLEPISLPADDPSTWTDEEIVDFYKKAAIKSKTAVKSQQTMTLESLEVNGGDGLLGTLVELVTPLMKSALKKNSTEFDGITGGYENLVVTDAESVKAYRSGEYIVVEMTMKEQTDGPDGDLHSGTVGHAISVVGDVTVVADELPQLVIDFENADIKLHYSEPKFKAKINKNGIIEKGSWTYTLNVDIANLYVAGANVPLSATADTAYGTVDYIVTVGGGF